MGVRIHSFWLLLLLLLVIWSVLLDGSFVSAHTSSHTDSDGTFGRHQHHHHPIRHCGTESLSDEEKWNDQSEVQKWLHGTTSFDQKRRKRTSAGTIQQYDCQQCITIDTYIHSIRAESDLLDEGANDVTVARLEEQMDILNEGFQATPFRFELKEITVTYNDTWASWDHTQQYYHRRVISAALRRGGPDSLNVFILQDLCKGLLGYSSLPDVRGQLLYPVGEFTSDDRIFLCPWALPQGVEPFHLGKTLIHETGHWLGLLHPFDGNSCDASNANDLVDDTPQQASSSMGLACPIDTRDSCPERPGKDLVQNYMEFSDDDCLQSFTPGQIERMLAQFDLYKRKLTPCLGVLFELQVLFDGHAVETNFQITEWKSTTIVPSARMVLKQDTVHVYDNKFATWHGCRESLVLYQFDVIDEGSDGIQSPGSYQLKFNGRTVAFGSRFPDSVSKRSLFVLGDAQPCQSMEEVRVSLDLVLGEQPSELEWSLRRKGSSVAADDDNDEIVLESTGVVWPDDEAIMASQPLFVDHCLSPGEYVLHFNNLGTGVFHYQVELDGVVLQQISAVLESDEFYFMVGGGDGSATTMDDTNSTISTTDNSSFIETGIPPEVIEAAERRGMNHQSLGMQRSWEQTPTSRTGTSSTSTSTSDPPKRFRGQ